MQSPVSAHVVKTMVFVALWCGLSSTAAAQSALTGIVHDPSLRVAVNAKVLVTDANTGKALPLTWTTAIGYYEIEVPPGDYRIHVEQNGLVYDGVVRVYPNEKAALDIELQYRSTEQLTVPATVTESDATLTSQASLSGTFDRVAIDSSPLSNGRVLQSFQSQVPGVVFTEATSTLAQFTADGQRRFANRLTIDGVSGDLAIDVRNAGVGESGSGVLPAVSTLGGTQTVVPLDAMEEMQIKTTDTTPQTARAPGAQTIIVTRSGSDRFAGNGFLDWRPERLSASDWFANGANYQKGPIKTQTGGISAGGPIISRQLFYFAAWERQHVERPLTATAPTPSLDAREQALDTVAPLLDILPVPNRSEGPNDLAGYFGEFPATSNLSTFSLRFDANLFANHRLFGRLNVGKSNGELVDAANQLPIGVFSSREAADTKTATIGLLSTRARLANDLRVNVSTSRGSGSAGPSAGVPSGQLPLDLLLPPGSSENALSTNGSFLNLVTGLAFGSATIQSGHSIHSVQTQAQVADTISISSRRHDWRFGVDTRWNFVSANPATVYTYRFRNFLQGRPQSLTTLETEPTHALFSNFSAFAEDSFRVSRRLSLNYGVRYDVEPAPSSRDNTQPYLVDIDALPTPVQADGRQRLWDTQWGNIAPRVGGIYQIGTASSYETTLRAGWGVAFDSLSLVGGNAFGGGYPYQSNRFAIVSALPVPQVVWSASSPQPFNQGDRNTYYAFASDFQSPRTYSWQVALEQGLGHAQRLSVTYVGAAGRELPYFYAENPYIRDTDTVGIARVNAFSNDGRSDYNALMAEYAWRLSHGLQVQVNYTWSHALDLDSGELVQTNASAPPNLIDPLLNRASADFDRRHVFLTTASYQLPVLGDGGVLGKLGSDWQFDTAVVYQSGAPINITSARDIGVGSGLYRPDMVSDVPPWIFDESSPGGRSLNSAAFAVPLEQRQGTLGRNTFQAFPLRQVDLSLSRSFRLGERVSARVRIDAFNVLNLANFGPPIASLDRQSDFGRAFQSYANALGTGTLYGGGLVPIQQKGGPRSVQIGVRFAF